MKEALVERLKEEIRYEFSREGPPEGFPKFPDIPAGRYREEGFFDLEMKHLWTKVWLYATRQEELPEPGSYQLWDYLHTPVVIVRDEEGLLHAFYNTTPSGKYYVEPHDDSGLYGERVFEEGYETKQRFQTQDEFPRRSLSDGVLKDPDTGQVYDLKGQPLSPTTGGDSLRELRCEVWDGWVFINQDLNAEPLLEWMHPLPEQMEMFQGEKLRLINKRRTVIPCNWKVTVEAFQEVYHFKHIHQKAGVSGLDQRGATMGVLPNGHSRMITPLSKRAAEMSGMGDQLDWSKDIMRALSSTQVSEVPVPGMEDIETVNGMTRCTSTAFSAFPNLVTPVAATGLPFLLAWPIDVRTTLFEWVTFCTDWGDGPSPVTDEAWQMRLNGFDSVMEEDTRNMAPMQKSLDSPGLVGMPTSYQERRIWNCAEQVDRMIGPEKIREDLRVPQLLGPYIDRSSS